MKNFKNRLCGMNSHYRFYSFERFFQEISVCNRYLIQDTVDMGILLLLWREPVKQEWNNGKRRDQRSGQGKDNCKAKLTEHLSGKPLHNAYGQEYHDGRKRRRCDGRGNNPRAFDGCVTESQIAFPPLEAAFQNHD